jgi:hypothetical protein
MQFSCVRCGFKFHNGLPPLEALSRDQSMFVGDDVNPVDQYVFLQGTIYDGLSPANLCDFCLRCVADYQQLYAADVVQPHRCRFVMVDHHTHRLECDDCDWTSDDFYRENNVDPYEWDQHVLFNRLMQIHQIFMSLRWEGDMPDLSELDDLLFVGMRKRSYIPLMQSVPYDRYYAANMALFIELGEEVLHEMDWQNSADYAQHVMVGEVEEYEEW